MMYFQVVSFEQGMMPLYRDEFKQKAHENAFKLASRKLKFVKESKLFLLLEHEVCYVNLQTQLLVDKWLRLNQFVMRLL